MGSREPWEVVEGGFVELTWSKLAFRKCVLFALVQNGQQGRDWKQRDQQMLLSFSFFLSF